MHKIVIVALAAALLSACAATLPVADYALIDSLLPGHTSKADVLGMFGEPAEIVPLARGQEEWFYWFQSDPLPEQLGLPAPHDPHREREVLRILFMASGVVMASESTRSTIQAVDADVPKTPPFGLLQ